MAMLSQTTISEAYKKRYSSLKEANEDLYKSCFYIFASGYRTGFFSNTPTKEPKMLPSPPLSFLDASFSCTSCIFGIACYNDHRKDHVECHLNPQSIRKECDSWCSHGQRLPSLPTSEL